MKLRLHSVATVLLVVSATACETQNTPGLEPISVHEMKSLLAPEPMGVRSDYFAEARTFRVFGVQPGDATHPGFVTIADTATWHARNVKVGDTMGRNIVVAALDTDRVEFRAAQQRWWVTVGQDFNLRVIQHAFDIAARDQGNHRWSVRPMLLNRVVERYGVGATGELVAWGSGEIALRLTDVRADGALARLGFQNGDLWLSVNGRPAQASDLQGVVAALTEPLGTPPTVAMARGPSRWVSTYTLQ